MTFWKKNTYLFFFQNVVDSFNDPNSKTRILLLSLTAGGVGLNLIGGNHLLLFDIHWNPQLESQAQDRIYRFGQKRDVYIYKSVYHALTLHVMRISLFQSLFYHIIFLSDLFALIQ